MGQKAEIYPKELSDYIKKTNYIPKKIKSVNEIKLYAKYFSLEEGKDGFKIEDIIEVDNQIYYQIKFLSNNRQALVPYEESFHYYELMTDKNDIKNLESIINTPILYFGSEIKYWFFSHNINLSGRKYKNFYNIIIESGREISDKKLYSLLAKYDDKKKIYYDCQAIQR